MMAKGYKVSSGGEENVLQMMVALVSVGEYNETH